MKQAAVMAVILVLLFIQGMGQPDPGLDAEAIALSNRAAGLMGQFNYDGAREIYEKLARKFHNNLEIKINLAIAVLNRQKEGDEARALSILLKVLEQDKTSLRAQYVTGLLELNRGEAQKALEYFKRILAAEPEDVDTLYFAGKTLAQLSQYQGALEYFQKAVQQDPYLQSAYYGMIMALRQLGKREAAMEMIKKFQELKHNPRARLVEFKYTKMGRRAEVLTLDLEQPETFKQPEGPLFQPGLAVSPGGEARWREFSGKAAPPSCMTVSDINGDNIPDVFIGGAVEIKQSSGKFGFGNAVLLGQPGKCTFTLDSRHPLARITGVNAALWGDLNEDGTADVYLCRKGPNQLWLRAPSGVWKESAAQTQTVGGNLDTLDGALVDADHDGDLDIFLVNGDGADELLNNNRDGTFRPLAAEAGLNGAPNASRSIVVTDLDGDRDADVIMIGKKPPHRVYINRRPWKYNVAKRFEAFEASDIAAAVAADLDTDGFPEIYTLDSREVLSRWKRHKTGTWQKMTFTGIKNPKKGTTCKYTNPGLAVEDVDGDGNRDILVSAGGGWRALAVTGGGIKIISGPEVKQQKPLSCFSTMTTHRGPSLLGWRPGEAPVLWVPGPGRYGFAVIRLSGRTSGEAQVRSNSSGIGTRLTVRAGSRWTLLDTFRNHSGPGQGLQPVAVGLGGRKHADFVAIDWSDGVFQTELNLQVGKTREILETQRQLSSCPVLFAWNGETYAFVSDLLGVGGMGYAVAPGEYAPPRPWENFMLPQGLLKPKNGRLEIKLLEPMEEAAYMDALRLKLYRLPPGWSMTLDERMGIAGPEPTGRVCYYRHKILPERAVNDRGQEVTDSVLTRDLKAAPPGPLDRRFIGRLEGEHVLELTFSRSLAAFPGRPVLVADGWVEYPYSQTNFAAWQAGAEYKAPTIEIFTAAGKWEVLLEQFGYPAGMPRQMSVPLEGLPTGVRKMRIRTNQEIYWDRLMVVYGEPCPGVKVHELPLLSARLEHAGFPRRDHLPQRLPYYDYDDRRPFWDTRFLEGFYTRFGDVLELVSQKDNGLAIFGAGEGLHLEFGALEVEPGDGWSSVYVLETEGWCKDMDLYTQHGETVGPVPHLGTLDARARDLNDHYNTRYYSGRQ